jgi:uncharacterized protein
MIGVVLDTNVVVSALLGSKGLEERVLKLALHRIVRLYVSTPILEEYEQVLLSPRLGLHHSLVRSSLSRIRAAAQAVHPMRTVTACGHGEDNRFLECAEAARAEFLITGNRRHFPLRWKQTTVVNARQFLELVGSSLRR